MQLTLSNIRGCEFAGLSLTTKDGGITTPACSDEVVLRADALQNELGEGPCLRAAWEERVVHSADLTADPRWPVWGPRVAQREGIHSILCVQLFTFEDTLGGMNMYSTRKHGFDASDVDEATALAAHIAIAVSSAETQAHLTRALDARTVIGQAVGIIMERYKLDSSSAFRVLVRTSSHANIKLRRIAQELVETGNLRGTPAPSDLAQDASSLEDSH
ncbi:GAF and ANTAR domain-containing protein [Aeromicrobium sp. 179-A 4D2 NHS]|uniref:GAF and ANTAR domain-containing protein n=1 Tax=Aeromicrobium sp. 179-A 4D2 NHS TaxID=3142375 RepID=UPI0039A35266